ncbi:type II toxin-antitoxin system toxin DNA ADP-ribosyl transferase DarT [Chitinimonas sp. JJ19]|uniref:type II toxin-antitoxin system toxin DNA ADP-ribosyl transferase DarT n=1 Tax=Chitinimonas sp. JJ19 TaxID=3109352 RepID=UPI003002EA66
MTIAVPNRPKLYHICHVDRLPSVVAQGGLLSDAKVQQAALGGTVIGMNNIKQRRLTELQLTSHSGLFVGQCVPFYFCPRSVMLYLIHKQNAELSYQGGQGPIVHLEADLYDTVAWANAQRRRWAFTLSNAGAYYFEDRADLQQLGELDWEAINARDWRGAKEGKQAEFLLEQSFPWQLIERIGVMSQLIATQVAHALPVGGHRPPVHVMSTWYY